MSPVVLRLVLVLLGAAVIVLAGLWWRRRDGRVLATNDGVRVAGTHLDAVGLDLAGAEAGAVLLGSPTCAPCTSVKAVLGEVAGDRPGFRWVYADAADHLDLARDHQVMRVPTLLVVAPDGQLLARTSGVPRADDLAAVLDDRAGLHDVA